MLSDNPSYQGWTDKSNNIRSRIILGANILSYDNYTIRE